VSEPDGTAYTASTLLSSRPNPYGRGAVGLDAASGALRGFTGLLGA
jgi:hypothetical protein